MSGKGHSVSSPKMVQTRTDPCLYASPRPKALNPALNVNVSSNAQELSLATARLSDVIDYHFRHSPQPFFSLVVMVEKCGYQRGRGVPAYRQRR